VARWEPDAGGGGGGGARGRLLLAALDLFADQGYEATTAAQVAERAGLTKTTLFRHFADKREILFQGQSALVSTATAGVRSAPGEASALEVLRCALRALADEHVPAQQEIGRRIDALVAASPELQERAAFKRSSIAAAVAAALADRLGDARLAGALADLGVRAYYAGFTAWTGPRGDEQLSALVLDELAALVAALSAALETPDA
jgi:AcrR family transcriptional regulator